MWKINLKSINMYFPFPSSLTPIHHHLNPMCSLTCCRVPFILSRPLQLCPIGSLHLPAILWQQPCCGQRYKILYFLVTELTLRGVFYGGSAALHYSGKTSGATVSFLRSWLLLAWLNSPRVTTIYCTLSCLIIFSNLTLLWSEYYPLSYGVPVRERYGSTLLPATREQPDQNCTQSH